MPGAQEDPKMASDREVAGKFPWEGQRTSISKPLLPLSSPAPEQNADVPKPGLVHSLLGWGNIPTPKRWTGLQTSPTSWGKGCRVGNTESQLAKDIMLWQVSGGIRYCHGHRKEKQLFLTLLPLPLLLPEAQGRALRQQHCLEESNGGQSGELWPQLSLRVTGSSEECWSKAVRENASLGSYRPRLWP